MRDDGWATDPRNLRYQDALWLKQHKRKKGRLRKWRKLCSKKELRVFERNRYFAELERADAHRERASGVIELVTLERLYEAQDGCCYYCLKSFHLRIKRAGKRYWNAKFNIEHKHPVSRGGTNEAQNLALACWRCNLEKFTMTEAEYREYRHQKFLNDMQAATSPKGSPAMELRSDPMLHGDHGERGQVLTER